MLAHHRRMDLLRELTGGKNRKRPRKGGLRGNFLRAVPPTEPPQRRTALEVLSSNPFWLLLDALYADQNATPPMRQPGGMSGNGCRRVLSLTMESTGGLNGCSVSEPLQSNRGLQWIDFCASLSSTTRRLSPFEDWLEEVDKHVQPRRDTL